MKEFPPQQIEQTRIFFENKNFPVETANLGALHVSYWVVPQAMNPGLPDFALRMTKTDPETKEVSGIFGVSDSVPAELRPYWAAHEIIEFTEIGIKTDGRCHLAEQKTLNLVPGALREKYINKRKAFFTNLIGFFKDEIKNNPESYSQDDVEEAAATLDYLNQTPGTFRDISQNSEKGLTAEERTRDIEKLKAMFDPDRQVEQELDESAEREKAFDVFFNTFHPTIKTIYYPGPDTDISPSKTLSFKDSQIIYIDHNKQAVQALQKAGYNAHVADAATFYPGAVDLLLLLNFYDENPLKYVSQNGYVICNRHWGGGLFPDMLKRKDFEFVGALTDASGEIKFDGENLEKYSEKPNYNKRKTENLFVFRKLAEKPLVA